MSDQPPGPERTTAPHRWKLTQRGLAACPSPRSCRVQGYRATAGPYRRREEPWLPRPLVAVLPAHEGRFGVEVGAHDARGARSGKAAGSGSGPEDASPGVRPCPSCPRGPSTAARPPPGQGAPSGHRAPGGPLPPKQEARGQGAQGRAGPGVAAPRRPGALSS